MAGGGGEELPHPHPARDAALPDADDPAEGDGRPRHQHEVGIERHQPADGEPPRDHLPPPDPEHDEGPDPAQHREQRHQRPAGAHEGQRSGQVLVVERAEARLPRTLERVALDDRDAREILLDGGGHRAELLGDRAARPVHLAGRDARPGEEHRVREQRQHGQPRRQPDQQGQRRRVDEGGVEQVQEPGAEQHPHGAEVAGHPRHHVAGGVPAVEAGVEPGQVLEQVPAQAVFDVASGVEDEDAGPGPDERLQHRTADDEDRIPDHHPVGGLGRQGPERVDRRLDEPGDGQREQVGRGQTGAPPDNPRQLGPEARSDRRRRRSRATAAAKSAAKSATAEPRRKYSRSQPDLPD